MYRNITKICSATSKKHIEWVQESRGVTGKGKSASRVARELTTDVLIESLLYK
jgi:hypothetical protein